jgi:hypothetical protein
MGTHPMTLPADPVEVTQDTHYFMISLYDNNGKILLNLAPIGEGTSYGGISPLYDIDNNNVRAEIESPRGVIERTLLLDDDFLENDIVREQVVMTPKRVIKLDYGLSMQYFRFSHAAERIQDVSDKLNKISKLTLEDIAKSITDK